jgi:hypothetical protein
LHGVVFDILVERAAGLGRPNTAYTGSCYKN